MAEISEKEMAARKVRKRPGTQVEHFIMRIEPSKKAQLVEMSKARGMNMSEFVVLVLDLSWSSYKKGKENK
jgi:hypothetical protein